MGNTQVAAAAVSRPKSQVSDRAEKRPEAAAEPRPTDTEYLYAPPATNPLTWISFFLIAGVLALGWKVRDEHYLIAESGLGYAFGIVGLALMILLLLYPLRKKARFMRNWGANKYWFQAHIIMGVLGPIFILFHANFRIGSLNSKVALTCTLVVAASGFVGRYIYIKIHYGLYGRKVNLEELKKNIEKKMIDLVLVLNYAPKLQQKLLAFDERALKTPPNFILSILHFLKVGVLAHWTHVQLILGLNRALKVTARRMDWSQEELKAQKRSSLRHISAHIRIAIRIAAFSVYERLFALWRLLHYPLFIMLLMVSAVHIVAVHLY